VGSEKRGRGGERDVLPVWSLLLSLISVGSGRGGGLAGGREGEIQEQWSCVLAAREGEESLVEKGGEGKGESMAQASLKLIHFIVPLFLRERKKKKDTRRRERGKVLRSSSQGEGRSSEREEGRKEFYNVPSHIS